MWPSRKSRSRLLQRLDLRRRRGRSTRSPTRCSISLLVNVGHNLAAGFNVLVHCQAGVHRAPILMAILLAWLRRTNFDHEYDRLEGMKAVDRQGVLRRRGGEALFSWARSSCAGNLPQLPRYPVVFIFSAKAGALRHVERKGAPWCRWRQASPGFRGDTHRATSVHEALGYDRQICKSCQAVLPSADRRALA